MSSDTALKGMLCATTAAAAVASIALIKTKKDADTKLSQVTKTSTSNGGCSHRHPHLEDDYQLYALDFAMHALHRQNAIAQLIKTAPSAKATPSAILLHGGNEIECYDTDRQVVFMQESFFRYLFGVKEFGCAGMIDVRTKESVLFVPRLDNEWEMWCGERKSLAELKAHYQVDAIAYIDEIPKVMQERGVKQLFVLHGKNTDSGLETVTTSSFEGMEADYKVDRDALHPVLVECRVRKTAAELDLLRFINKLSSEAHIEVMKRMKPGLMEFHSESIFCNYCYSKGGARSQAYVCICGSGHNASALHYGHAGAPNDKKLVDGDIFLNDMGAELHGYASDITCTYPVNGHFTPDQKFIYEAVLASHDAVIAAVKPGVTYEEMHMLSHRVMTQYFLDHGLFKNGTVDELMEHEISAYIYPHGLGHLMGLDTHDVGGFPVGHERSKKKILSALRCVRELVPGVVITVEPGCYFIEAQIRDLLANPETAKYINVEMLERFRHTGGVRIESDIIITADGCEVMTKVPRTVAEIEKVMQTQQWP